VRACGWDARRGWGARSRQEIDLPPWRAPWPPPSLTAHSQPSLRIWRPVTSSMITRRLARAALVPIVEGRSPLAPQGAPRGGQPSDLLSLILGACAGSAAAGGGAGRPSATRAYCAWPGPPWPTASARQLQAQSQQQAQQQAKHHHAAYAVQQADEHEGPEAAATRRRLAELLAARRPTQPNRTQAGAIHPADQRPVSGGQDDEPAGPGPSSLAAAQGSAARPASALRGAAAREAARQQLSRAPAYIPATSSSAARPEQLAARGGCASSPAPAPPGARCAADEGGRSAAAASAAASPAPLPASPAVPTDWRELLHRARAEAEAEGAAAALAGPGMLTDTYRCAHGAASSRRWGEPSLTAHAPPHLPSPCASPHTRSHAHAPPQG
jgi:hypothetical protein